jgi:ADP-heptose:LPS heptosyltransferase
MKSRHLPQKIAVLNIGGIGDALLFEPVLALLRQTCPTSHITLLLEDRSQSVVPLLSAINAHRSLAIQGMPKAKIFLALWKALAFQGYDAVLASGSSPFIAPLLASTGIGLRIGFNTGALSHILLTKVAPLKQQQYASAMYYQLAHAWVNALDLSPGILTDSPIPHLPPPSNTQQQWAKQLLPTSTGKPTILLHPGVSQVSVNKGIYKGWDAAHWATCIHGLTPWANVVLAGGPDDASTINSIISQLPVGLSGFVNAYGQTKNLADLAALIHQADCLLAVDSSPLHVGVGLNKPVVALFGPTNEEKLIPPNCGNVKVVTVPNLPCRPCLWHNRQVNCASSHCLLIDPVTVITTVRSLLAG